MSAILAVLETGARQPGDRAFRRALSASGSRPGDRLMLHMQPGAALGMTQPPSAPFFPSDNCPGFAIDDDYIVLVDGSLFYIDDLCRALGHRVGRSATTGELVLEAFRRFGAACVDRLEGDFALLVWNRHTREVFCARDFTGRRPLFLAEWSAGLVVATSLDSIAALQGFSPAINPVAVAADAAGLFFALDDETCMHGVQSLRSGHTCLWLQGKRIRSQRFWFPESDPSTLSFADASLALCDLLTCAAFERISEFGPTAVWMSGGRDSTAVFGAGMRALGGSGALRSLLPVSRSHPPGDSGREDEAIEAVAKFWRVSPNWVDAQTVSLFGGLRNRGRWSSEPFAQPFEGLARALARAGKSFGASIALDGYGGDFLFQVSRVYLADLLSQGKMLQAIGEWRAMDRRREGVPGFVRYGVQPMLPRWAKRKLSAGRGVHAMRSAMQRSAPPWINRRLQEEHSFADRFASLGPDAQPGSTAVDREAQFYLTHQFFARINARMTGFAMDEGVELRSPLLDARVVRFALSRPRAERNDVGDQKKLLRASMRGLLPDSVTAPRVGKSGTLTSYFAQEMWKDGLRRLNQMLPVTELAGLGIVDPDAFTRAVDQYRSLGTAYPHVESLFCTLEAENWLRSRSVNAASELAHKTAGSA